MELNTNFIHNYQQVKSVPFTNLVPEPQDTGSEKIYSLLGKALIWNNNGESNDYNNNTSYWR